MAFKGQPGSHKEPYWEAISRIVKESDVVLEVLDARLVELSRNEVIEEIIEEQGRPMIFVINKSDLVSKDKLRNDVEKLKKKGTVVFVSTKQKGGSKSLLYAIKKVFKKHGKREYEFRDKFSQKPLYREARANVVVGILGYPNVGKSSIINALAHKKKTKVSKKSGTTHGVHWINISKDIKILDSPGVIPLKVDDEIRYGLIGARDIEKLKDPEIVAHAIIKLFLKNNKKALEEFYKNELETTNPEKIINALSEKKGFLLKGGVIDENRMIKVIIKDWQEGRLRL